MEKKIQTQKELFKLVKPALRTKVHELYNVGIKIVSMEDIWEYHKSNSWKDAEYLSLASIVDDILNTENKKYEEFVLKKYKIEQVI